MTNFCVILLIFLASLSIESFSQNQSKPEPNEKPLTFTGAATLTTKGLSTFPNLTLGKPAAIFDCSTGGNKFRFEPTLRFGLDGKPWTFIFWLRYEILNTKNFQLKLGVHPAYAFKTISVTENGIQTDIHRVQQFVAAEIAPIFKVAKYLNMGPYYLYAYGITDGAVQNSHFVAIRANFTNIELSDKYFLKCLAMAYYLKMDANDGFYLNTTLSAFRRNFPLSVSSTINYKIESKIPGEDFLWNVNLTYSFGGKYMKL